MAAVLILLYGAAVVFIGFAWFRLTGQAGGFVRVGVRVLGTMAVAYGLWRGERWAWWVGAVFSAALAVAGLAGFVLLRRAGALDLVPNPSLYWRFVFGSVIVLAAAFILLLSPAARRAALYRPPLVS